MCGVENSILLRNAVYMYRFTLETVLFCTCTYARNVLCCAENDIFGRNTVYMKRSALQTVISDWGENHVLLDLNLRL